MEYPLRISLGLVANYYSRASWYYGVGCVHPLLVVLSSHHFLFCSSSVERPVTTGVGPKPIIVLHLLGFLY